MKYISLESVTKSYAENAVSTSNKFWGLLAIISALDQEVRPCVSYTFEVQNVSNLLENLFALKKDKRTYSQTTKWGVIFSNKWVDYVNTELLSHTPNIYDIIGWYFRNTPLDDDINNEKLIKLFLETSHFSIDVAKQIFDFKPKVLSFSDNLYLESQLASTLKTTFNISPTTNTTITLDKNFVVASPGELARAPFVQPLYAGQGVQECLILTQFSFEDMYTTKEKSFNLLDQPLQQIFYGAPGTGKSHEIEQLTNGSVVFRTTFHPDSDYSTFVGAYKPIMREVPMTTVIGTKVVPVEDKEGHPLYESKIQYEFVPQAFAQAYVEAWKDLDTPVFLVIEEINRGNCAQIFGDIFQLLDRRKSGFSNYYIVPDEDLRQYIAKAFKDGIDERAFDIIKTGQNLCLPPNLYIWATMNTSDQSLFPIDSAFKRRWDWQYIPIEDAELGWTINVNGNKYDWWKFLQAINKEVFDLTLSEDKQLGYFFVQAKDNVIDAKVLVNKVFFYLWNDVFKDFDLDNSKVFRHAEGQKSVCFKDFYVSAGEIKEDIAEQILINLGLENEA